MHVFRNDSQAKFWLNPVRLESSHLFRPVEERQIEQLVAQYAHELIEAWYEYFPH